MSGRGAFSTSTVTRVAQTAHTRDTCDTDRPYLGMATHAAPSCALSHSTPVYPSSRMWRTSRFISIRDDEAGSCSRQSPVCQSHSATMCTVARVARLGVDLLRGAPIHVWRSRHLHVPWCCVLLSDKPLLERRNRRSATQGCQIKRNG